MPTPTEQQYEQFQKLYNHFNKVLFDNQLPSCLLFLSTQVKKITGHFESQRWENEVGNTTYEITMNPYFMSESKDIEICKKLVEVMVTLWQHEHGTPSRKGYYNQEYADKLEKIGLTASNTGKIGGKKVGQKMDSCPNPNGMFIKAVNEISKEWLIPFRLTKEEWSKLSIIRKKRWKTTFRCSCGDTIWGKPDLKATCNKCGTSFKKVVRKPK